MLLLTEVSDKNNLLLAPNFMNEEPLSDEGDEELKVIEESLESLGQQPKGRNSKRPFMTL